MNLTKFIIKELSHKMDVSGGELMTPEYHDAESMAYHTDRVNAIEAVLANPTYETLANHPAAIDALEDAKDIAADNTDPIWGDDVAKDARASVRKLQRAIDHAKSLR